MAWAIIGIVFAMFVMLLGVYKQKNGLGRNRNRNRD